MREIIEILKLHELQPIISYNKATEEGYYNFRFFYEEEFKLYIVANADIMYITVSEQGDHVQLLYKYLNESIPQEKTKWGKVNSKLYKIAYKFNSLLEGIYTKTIKNNTPIVLGGYGLSAGIAYLLTSLFLQNLNSYRNTTWLYKLVTLSQPKVGDNEFCKKFDIYFQNHTRYLLNTDILPILPSKEYSHSGNCIHLNNGYTKYIDEMKVLESLATTKLESYTKNMIIY